jgi:O6-methylguanine-DNA--protein-cysteine methyltransferase
VGTDAATQAFTQLRQQIRTQYERILQARDWERKTVPSMLDVFGPLRPVADSVVQPILNALDELVQMATDEYEKLAPIEWDFVQIANHDSDVWKQVKQIALGAVRDVNELGDDKNRVTSAAEAQANAMDRDHPVVPADPNAHSPWSGRTGNAYGAQISPQAIAAQFMADLAQDASEFLRQSGENFGSVVAALTILMQQIVMFWILLAAAFFVLCVEIRAAIAAPQATLPAALVALGAFAAAGAQRLMMVTPAIVTYQNAQNIFRNNTSRRIQDLDTRLNSAPDVFHYRGRGASQWPDPTQVATFPHVTQDRGGSYRVTTDPR